MTPEERERLKKIEVAKAVADQLDTELLCLWQKDRHDSRLLDDSMRADKTLKLLVKEYKGIYRKDPPKDLGD